MATLLGQWAIQDNVEDSSGNGRHASVNFTPTYIDGPHAGTRAIRFTASGQSVNYGRTGLEPTTGGMVTMAWIKMFSPGPSGYCSIFHKNRGFDSTRHGIDIHNNNPWWMSRWRDQFVFGDGSSIALDTWHHIANVDSDDRYAWFVNGVQVAGASRSGGAPVIWDDFPWMSGYDPNTGGNNSHTNIAFSGIRMFQGTMTNTEVNDWMAIPVTSGRSGRPKVWNGSLWVPKPAKYWNGTAWVEKPMKGYDGSAFVKSK